MQFQTAHNAQKLTPFQLTDCIRALAAYIVVFGHAIDLSVYRPSITAHAEFIMYYVGFFAHDAVMVFFVLSGFWVTKSCTPEKRQFIWRKYLVDRLSRLWIVLIPALLLTFAVDTIGLYFVGGPFYSGTLPIDVRARLTDIQSTLTLSNFFANAFFVPTIYWSYFGSNAPLWSVIYEFWYYLWFPCIFYAFKKREIGLPLLFSILTMYLLPAVFFYFPIWLLGSLVLWAYRASKGSSAVNILSEGSVRCRSAIMVSITVFSVLALFAKTFYLRYTFVSDFCTGIIFAIFLMSLLITDLRYSRLFLPVAKFGASASFSLYAIHFPLVVLFSATVTGGQLFKPNFYTIVLIYASTSLYVIAAVLFSWATEKRTQRVRKFIQGVLPQNQPPVANDIHS